MLIGNFSLITNPVYAQLQKQEFRIKNKIKNEQKLEDLINKCVTILETSGKIKLVSDNYGEKLVLGYSDNKTLAIEGHLRPYEEFDDDYNLNHYWLTNWGYTKNGHPSTEPICKVVFKKEKDKLTIDKEVPMDKTGRIDENYVIKRINETYECLIKNKCKIEFK